jgi:hypothetical protein
MGISKHVGYGEKALCHSWSFLNIVEDVPCSRNELLEIKTFCF